MRKADDTVKVHLSELSSIILQTTQVYLSAHLLSELAKCEISLVVADEKCNPVGQYLPLYGAHNAAKRIAEQVEWGAPIKKRVWQRIVQEKIRQQARLLEEIGRADSARALYALRGEVKSGDTTNREAAAARIYFSALFGDDFTRDDKTSVNAALNYGYAVLLSLVNREVVSRGYLTQCGICHRNEYNHFNLSCDFMEPFRPIVDRIVFDYVEREPLGEIRKLLGNLGACVVAYEGGSYRLHSVIALFVQHCLAALSKTGELDEIKGFEQ